MFWGFDQWWKVNKKAGWPLHYWEKKYWILQIPFSDHS
jgi:hypothetical protein